MTKSNLAAQTTVSPPNQEKEDPRIIAIGASAGGLEALKSFFDNISETDKNAYVVVQHLSPDYKSMMGELLRKNTNLPIVEISDSLQIRQGHIYLIPPVNNLVLENNRLHLVDKPKDQSLNLPIDIFFESLAKIKKEKAIGVILSGTGSDGTRGIRAIKENDGMIMVQDPEEAKFDGMPQSAINTGLVDYVLSVEEMGEELKNFISAPSILHFKNGDISVDENILDSILHFVDENTGLDFREYKKATLVRRISRRVNVCKCNSLSDYHSFLENNPQEVEILYREFLIGVTKFFRDENVWKVLRDEVIPELVASKTDGEVLKVWDVGCSSGEEAYSFAMIINEEIEKQNKKIELKIFATDISEKHLRIGSRGFYPESIVADVDNDLLLKYFVSKANGYRIIDKLRRMVVFSRHNIIKNPPFSNMDMAICRNLLIYFQPGIQNKALNMLHYSLVKNGILVLGTSESVYNQKDNFSVIDRAAKIYKNLRPSKRLKSDISEPTSLSGVKTNNPKERTVARNHVNPVKTRLQDELTEGIMESFGGASVLLDSDYNVLHALGEFRKYAHMPSTGFSINLLDMLDGDFKFILQTTLKKAKSENKKMKYPGAVFEENGEKKSVDIFIKPFSVKKLENNINYIVTFIEKEIFEGDLEELDKITLTNRTKEYVSSLEEELKYTKEELNASVEEIETSNEELQAANEELLASNEELQSTNEELQSVNEEINTVNAENLQKVEDLAALNADMNNLLESTQIGTIFLDTELKIRKFTPAIKAHFNLINSDEGRPIVHFTDSMGKNNLIPRCKQVLKTGKILEKHVITKSGYHYLRRISPYIDSKENISGVVITFIDISSVQKSRDKLIASEKRFKTFYEEDPVLHISVDPQSSIILQCNNTAVQELGYDSKDELIGKLVFDLYEEEAQIKALKSNKEFQETGELKNIEQDMLKKTGETLPVILSATAEKDEENKITAIRYTCVDISAQKKAEEKLKRQKADLERANYDLEQFVSICSHDLQEPLSTIKFGSDVLGKIYFENLDEKGQNYLSYIKDASTRLAEQIKALLEHSRIGRNGEKKLVNIQELVEVVKYDLGKSIKDTKAKIHIGKLPKLEAYEIELRLLFQNLIGNAIKYTPKDRNPEIRISAFKEGKFYVFSIVDNGVGISEEDQKTIFTIFNRVEDSQKDGTGVGLAHVKKIIELHEGNIWVDSQVGVGSNFYFKIKA
ncbi:chemotaxis protein CheB [Salegentibacter sp.]|uniref:chemotaxis protein CheB n=1 Tax=Salegentibacter sp. TaxID=1903072 RepID=UPI00356A870B